MRAAIRPRTMKTPPRPVITLLVCVALATSACITPTGKPYDERLASRLTLGASNHEVLHALGRPRQAEPLGSIKDAACNGRSESWTYSYLLPGKIECSTTLSFDERGTLCARVSSTTLPGAQCQGGR